MENNRIIRILFIEDSENDVELILRLLRKNNFLPQFENVDNPEALKNTLSEKKFDLILADYSMPSYNGLQALEFIKSEGIDVPFILLSGSIGEEIAVEAMRKGAADYIMKNNMTRLLPAIEREIREYKIRIHREQIQEILKEKNEQLKIAKIIQRGLFPQNPPDLKHFDVGGNSYPAEETGGDYFDFIPMLDQTLGLVVGDVSGHGLGPSLLMSSTRAYLRAFCLNFIDLGKILENVNKVLFEDISDGKRFVTLFFASLDPIEKSIIFSNAGHTSGYVLDKSGRIKHELKSMNLPLGIQKSTEYTNSSKILLETGDICLFATDGLFEAKNSSDEKFGIEKAIQLVHDNRNLDADKIVELLYKSTIEFRENNIQEDDITAIVVKTK